MTIVMSTFVFCFTN